MLLLRCILQLRQAAILEGAAMNLTITWCPVLVFSLMHHLCYVPGVWCRRVAVLGGGMEWALGVVLIHNGCHGFRWGRGRGYIPLKGWMGVASFNLVRADRQTYCVHGYGLPSPPSPPSPPLPSSPNVATCVFNPPPPPPPPPPRY